MMRAHDDSHDIFISSQPRSSGLRLCTSKQFVRAIVSCLVTENSLKVLSGIELRYIELCRCRTKTPKRCFASTHYALTWLYYRFVARLKGPVNRELFILFQEKHFLPTCGNQP